MKITEGIWYHERGAAMVHLRHGTVCIADCSRARSPGYSSSNLIPAMEREANAMLCAEAPALLEELRELVRLCEEDWADPAWWIEVPGAAKALLDRLKDIELEEPTP